MADQQWQVKVYKCSCHNPAKSAPEDPLEKAWKAIEDGETSKLEGAIKEMKESESGSSAVLDTCRLIERSGVTYSMSLLALCGFHGRMEMVDMLLEQGADMNAKCTCVKHTGTPISQMMLHCHIQFDYDKLSVEMLEYFIQKLKSAAKEVRLCGKISTRHVNLLHRYTGGGVNYVMLDLPLSIKRVDCAKVLVEAGVDLLSGGCPSDAKVKGEKFDVVPMFQEYRDHGTNEFIRWAFNEYIPNHPEIDLEQIIHSLINMKEKDKKSCFWQSVQRTPAHAILTSHHEETIKQLVQCGKENGLDLLDERSCTGKTALHVAAENNDVKSVQILLQLGADTRASDNSDMKPFMIALEKGHLEVVKAMMRMDPGLVSLLTGFRSTVIHWALEKGHNGSVFFKGCFEENPKGLLGAEDSQGNRVTHLVAASGNTEVFEILWSKEFAEAVFSDRNSEDKTPLQLAVENGHVNILKTLKTCVDKGREAIPPQWHRRLQTNWWSKMVPYFLYACSCGSLDAVKYFIDSGREPNISHNDKTPLLCAAEAGHDEIVAYLLQFTKVRTDLQNQPEKVYSASGSPLLIAVQDGHTKCVIHLLQKGGNVLQRDYKNRNCLRIAIENHHKDTALAILSDKNGMEALKRGLNPAPSHLLVKRDKTPLQLLVEEMPDLAEYVLNKCITQSQPGRQISISGENFVDNPTVAGDQPVHYNFDYLEDKDGRISQKHHGSHILDWMIEHNRLELLQHPLVENFLFQKFWVMTFPLFLLNLLFYCALLVALNSFALVVPRPGPDSETCPESDVALNGTSSDCQGQSEYNQRFLTAAAITLCFLSILGLLVEFLQLMNRRWRYFEDSDNYFQLALYLSIVIFIFGFDNDCWCSTPWQWQIGAFAVFLSWLNFIFILKYMPYTAVPINMFLSICVTFLKLIFLPIVLILAFGMPHYMVFVRTTSSSEQVGNLTAFRSPGHAVAKTLLQLVGEFDFEATFNQGALLYNPTAYILFITFLITMPVLFTNLLIGLAVGDTQKEREKAEFTKLKVWVEFILERERSRGILRGLHMQCKRIYCPRSHELESAENCGYCSGNGFVLTLFGREFSLANLFINFFLKRFGKEYAQHAEIVKELAQRNDEIYRTVMAHNLDDIREDINELKQDIRNLKQDMTVAHIEPVDAREDITKLKEDINNLKQEMTNLVQAVTSWVEAASFNH